MVENGSVGDYGGGGGDHLYNHFVSGENSNYASKRDKIEKREKKMAAMDQAIVNANNDLDVNNNNKNDLEGGVVRDGGVNGGRGKGINGGGSPEQPGVAAGKTALLSPLVPWMSPLSTEGNLRDNEGGGGGGEGEGRGRGGGRSRGRGEDCKNLTGEKKKNCEEEKRKMNEGSFHFFFFF